MESGARAVNFMTRKSANGITVTAIMGIGKIATTNVMKAICGTNMARQWNAMVTIVMTGPLVNVGTANYLSAKKCTMMTTWMIITMMTRMTAMMTIIDNCMAGCYYVFILFRESNLKLGNLL